MHTKVHTQQKILSKDLTIIHNYTNKFMFSSKVTGHVVGNDGGGL